MGYTYDDETRAFYPNPPDNGGTETQDGVKWQVRYMVLCASNTVDEPNNGMCPEAMCELNGVNGAYVQVFRRESASDPWEPWPGRERICHAEDPPGDPIPLADVEDEIMTIIEEHYEAISEPQIDVAPSVNAVVNLPVLASTEDVGMVGFDIENPLPGTVEAEPHYVWTWSNGAEAAGPGQVYDGTDPISHPEHYPVRAVYGGSGDKSVDLTATWSITLSVEGIPPITDIEPLVYTATETFTVHSARTVLVD